MKVINYARRLLVIALPLLASTVNASVSPTDGRYPYNAPGIVDPSWPLFLDTNETVKVQKNGSGSNSYWTLTGTGANTSFWGGLLNHVNVGNDSVKYQANFNSAGKLITSMGSTALINYLEINGSLPAGNFGGTSWSAQPNQLLLKATLVDKNPGNGTPDLIGTFAGSALGFNTKFTGGWAPSVPGLTGGSTGESLWLAGLSSGFQNLVKALDGNNSNGTLTSLFGSTKTITGVASVSSVPVPGAVWLFLTGMMTLLGFNRKKASSGFAV